MGIFDVIELKNHVQSIGEYVFYMADYLACSGNELPSELLSSLNFIRDHLKKMSDVLQKLSD